MPNIEIHGMNKERAEDLRERIFEEFEGEPYLKEIVVTICPSIVKDAEKKDQPFLRLIDDDVEGYARKILNKLSTLKLDIEYLKLTVFLPKIT